MTNDWINRLHDEHCSVSDRSSLRRGATLRSAWVIWLPQRKLERSDSEQCESCNLYISQLRE